MKNLKKERKTDIKTQNDKNTGMEKNGKTEMEEHKILIVSGGSIEDVFVHELIENNEYGTLIACDRGMEFFWRNALRPDLILGDFDSVDRAVLESFRKQTDVRLEQFPAKKDWTDTELAVRRALELGADRIDLVGATGSRLDHVFGNLQLLALGLEQGVQILLMDANNRIRLIDRPLTLKKKEQFGDFVSLIPHGGAVCGLTLTGMKYPLEDGTLTPDISLGISNEIADEEATISFTQGALFVMETRD